MRRFVVIAVVVAGIAVGLAWFAWARRPAGLVLQETPPRLRDVWPLDSSWSWSFPAPPAGSGDRMALRFRVKATPSSPTSSPVFQDRDKPMSRAEADRHFDTGTIGWPGTVDRPASGTATVQLLDLARVGAASDRAGQNLRVLANVSVGGISTQLSNDDIYLPTGQFVRRNVLGQGERWVDGELHLMSFWIEGDGTLSRYDVLLDTGSEDPSH